MNDLLNVPIARLGKMLIKIIGANSGINNKGKKNINIFPNLIGWKNPLISNCGCLNKFIAISVKLLPKSLKSIKLVSLRPPGVISAGIIICVITRNPPKPMHTVDNPTFHFFLNCIDHQSEELRPEH